MRTLHEWMQLMEEKRQAAEAQQVRDGAAQPARTEEERAPGSAQTTRPSSRSNKPVELSPDERAAMREATARVLDAVPPRLKTLRENAQRALQARQARQQALPLEVDQPPQRRRRRTTAETREELIQRLLDPQLTLQETAKLLNVCPTTVRRYTNRGILRHTRTPGNQRRFRLSDVLEFMERQQQE
ncbi:MAG: helix-turn-helix domain-containing protein [Armatimonadota bacterium]